MSNNCISQVVDLKENNRKGDGNMTVLKPLENKETISSLELCEVINKFREDLEGKKELLHKDLLKIIRSEFEEEIREGKISPSSQTVEMPNGGVRKQPMFELTFNQAKQVLLREHKSVRKAVIKYIETLENRIADLANQLSQKDKLILKVVNAESTVERMVAVAEYTEAVERPLLETIEEQKPKVHYVDTILQNSSLVSISQIAKDYGMSGQSLNKKLNELKVQYKQSGQWLLYSKYQDKGYTHSETRDLKEIVGVDKVVMHTKWTQKGRLFLYELLKKNCILPVVER